MAEALPFQKEIVPLQSNPKGKQDILLNLSAELEPRKRK